MTDRNPTAAKPLYATLGAGDALYSAVVDVVTQVRERTGRVEEVRERFANVPADAQTQFESLRERLSGLPSELPEDLAELREKFTAEELRSLADRYYHQLLDLYSDLAVRGEETAERLRANHLVEERIEQVENLYKDATHRAEDVLGRVNEIFGRPAKSEDEAAPVDSVVEAEVIEVITETEPAPAAEAEADAEVDAEAKPAAKKAAPRKAPAKKAAPKQD
ncbi:heparin-binding hemagglutinin [Nocardia panacis]|uniref:Heparin-binding hemagglutinin n=1 Tax=Nocardia panacis TaxID=2340916 RepID=A0A3A4KSU9_9NOCA|nr:heparin-binding hemagglutinin [Nocardia panacis]RJO76586.1 heparin-binding hemagglutinin [Nocardia panacis]